MNADDVPELLRTQYRDWRWALVWQLTSFAATWRLDRGDSRSRYLKVCALPPIRDERPLFIPEAARMLWAGTVGLRVPALIEVGEDGAVDWLISEAIDGVRTEIHPRRAADPLGVSAALGRALGELHAVPADVCPFDRTLDVALADRRRRLVAGQLAFDTMHPDHERVAVGDALARLERERPAAEDVVVCHRDFNEANVLLDDDGSVCGVVDLGFLGRGDRWCDLAVTSWYLEQNHGPEGAHAFFDAYGIEPDPARIDYYRLLYSIA